MVQPQSVCTKALADTGTHREYGTSVQNGFFVNNAVRCTRNGNTILHLAIIAGLLDDFRGHPVGGPNEGVALGHGARQLSSHPKVSQLDLPSICQQDVATLYVPVHLQAPPGALQP